VIEQGVDEVTSEAATGPGHDGSGSGDIHLGSYR
jgi:hypothetical protein